MVGRSLGRSASWVLSLVVEGLEVGRRRRVVTWRRSSRNATTARVAFLPWDLESLVVLSCYCCRLRCAIGLSFAYTGCLLNGLIGLGTWMDGWVGRFNDGTTLDRNIEVDWLGAFCVCTPRPRGGIILQFS